MRVPAGGSTLLSSGMATHEVMSADPQVCHAIQSPQTRPETSDTAGGVDGAAWSSAAGFSLGREPMYVEIQKSLIGTGVEPATGTRQPAETSLWQGETLPFSLRVDQCHKRVEWGRNSLNVYGREGHPCKRCGSAIVRERFMNRSSHFCPVCQRKR
jgi:hypothetical protein